jgi:hypothetical protein
MANNRILPYIFLIGQPRAPGYDVDFKRQIIDRDRQVTLAIFFRYLP